MRSANDLLTIIEQAAVSFLGWSFVIYATFASACWAATCLHEETMASPLILVAAPVLVVPAVIVFPQVLVGIAVSLVSFYLPLRVESRRLSFTTAVVHFAIWFGLTLSIL